MIRTLKFIKVTRSPGTTPSTGLLLAGRKAIRCRIGRNGFSAFKREADETTPIGRFRLLGGWYREDRIRLPPTLLPFRPITARDGWCDAPDHPCYNQPVTLPFNASHEIMMRADGLYDICIVMDHNQIPRIRNRGSAVFFHLAADRPETAGCIATSRYDMLRLLPRLGPSTGMIIAG